MVWICLYKTCRAIAQCADHYCATHCAEQHLHTATSHPPLLVASPPTKYEPADAVLVHTEEIS